MRELSKHDEGARGSVFAACELPSAGVKSKVANIRANIQYFRPQKGSPMATMEAPPRLQVRLHEGAVQE